MNGISLHLGETWRKQVDAALADWDEGKKLQRLFARDASLWTGKDESKWLGWLDVVDAKAPVSPELRTFVDGLRPEGFRHALLLGMGGSSLCPEVMARTFGPVQGAPTLLVLDSTDPEQVQSTARRIDPAKTLFIVSSKSGSTLEPNIFFQFFWELAKKAVGEDEAGSRFVAITDPGSKMEAVARAHRFRAVFPGRASIGGRYSALSNFGLVPAAVMGMDLDAFLGRTLTMVQACAPAVPAKDNPGAVLGAALGVLGREGRNKVTLVTSPGIEDLGAWLEQLIAESTGKEGKGLIPVDREALGAPGRYGDDRLFAYLRLHSAPDAGQDSAVDALVHAGQPVVRIDVSEPLALGEEYFRWELATAVAGALLGINPFDQPDVEAAKVETRLLTDQYERAGKLPEETPFWEDGRVALFTDSRNAEALKGGKDLAGVLRAHFGRLEPGDYLAVLGFIPMKPETERALQAVRMRVRDAKRVATCLGFGPRFLHSTGQAYKGGPNSGVFLQITCDDAVELPVPGQKFSFGTVKAAQARGDFEVLVHRGRRALRVHLKGPLAEGLRTLDAAAAQALS